MYHKHHTKGIVVGSREDGLDSKRINIFTENFGLINGKVQGSRKLNSKLRSASQDFTVGEFSLVRGKNGWKVVSVRGDSNVFEDLRNSKNKLRAGVNVLNLLKKLAPEEARMNDEVGQESSPSLFDIVKNFLDFILNCEEDLIILAECLVLIRILNNLGYLREVSDLKEVLQTSEITRDTLEILASRKQKMIDLINESLKVTHLT